MTLIAQVYVNIQVNTLNRPFTYIVPDGMDDIAIGCRVLVPFGARCVEGFVVELSESESLEGLKPILEVLDNSLWFDAEMLQTARWMSEEYIATLPDTLRLFIPGGSGIKTDYLYSLNQMMEVPFSPLIADIANRGYGLQSELLRKYGSPVLKELQALVKKDILFREIKTQKTNKPLTLKQICLKNIVNVTEIHMQLKNKPAQLKLFDLLLEKGPLLLKKLPFYNVTPQTAANLVKQGSAYFENVQVMRDSYKSVRTAVQPFQLNSQQMRALSEIDKAITGKKHQTYLLFGITGSGKTEVYMHAAERVCASGKQVIVLVPEIALTSQIVHRFKARFGELVVVIHSKLNKQERFDSFERLRSGQAKICIGARSAVFAPCYDLGLVIIDEEHEFTYKQEEYPHYHARDVAIQRASYKNAVVLLGSATPSVESFYHTQQGTYKLLTMSERVDGAALPEVQTVDMREELKQGRRTVVSGELSKLILDALTKKEQVILLLNRRGYSTFVLCRECGHVMKCPHCSVPLVYHQQHEHLRCHYCDYTEGVPDICPVCSSRYIKYFGTGTQKLEQELKELYPAAKIVRMDQDTTRKKFASDSIMKDFSQGKYDILLGTQMVAKGHDIKNVTAVGIISADTALNLPDFRAAERTFALLTQASGRAGRGEKSGRVVIQTYSPEHYAIQCATKHDYLTFYNQEIEFRRELNYPPFKNIIKITVTNVDEKAAWQKANRMVALFNRCVAHRICEVIGPFPPPVSKIKNAYRINVMIKTDDVNAVRKVIVENELIQQQGISIDVNPVNVL